MEKRRLWISRPARYPDLSKSNAREPGQDDVNGTIVERFDDTRDAPTSFTIGGRQTPISIIDPKAAGLVRCYHNTKGLQTSKCHRETTNSCEQITLVNIIDTY
jgi:hypothetical protein